MLPDAVKVVAQIPAFSRFFKAKSNGIVDQLDGEVNYADYTRVWKPVYEKYNAVQFPCLWQHMGFPKGFSELSSYVIASMTPSRTIKEPLLAFSEKHRNYVAVHARTEGDWKDYCPEFPENPACFLSTYTIIQILKTHLPSSSTVYV